MKGFRRFRVQEALGLGFGGFGVLGLGAVRFKLGGWGLGTHTPSYGRIHRTYISMLLRPTVTSELQVLGFRIQGLGFLASG